MGSDALLNCIGGHGNDLLVSVSCYLDVLSCSERICIFELDFSAWTLYRDIKSQIVFLKKNEMYLFI